MNTTTPSLYRRDLAAHEFALLLVIGMVLSGSLSYLHVPGLLSVGFAVFLMLALSLHRWIIARRANDAESLEVFGDEIYLMGYLLTLAALLGLVPRLASDEANLINIAGLKLTTTVVGLALMMMFKQAARRWAAQLTITRANEFVEQQKRFGDAIARVSQGADDLCTKLTEVTARFDSRALTPIVEWSNQAAASFTAATGALNELPKLVKSGHQQIEELGSALQKARLAADELSGSLSVGAINAATQLTGKLVQSTQAVSQFGTSIAGVNPASEAAGQALANLGQHAALDAQSLRQIGDSLKQAVSDLGKVERVLKKMGGLQTTEIDSPMTRLVQALESSNANAKASTTRLDQIQQDLVKVAEQFERTMKHLEGRDASGSSDKLAQPLITGIERLRQEMIQMNEKLLAIVSRIDEAPVRDNKTGRFFGRFLSGR